MSSATQTPAVTVNPEMYSDASMDKYLVTGSMLYQFQWCAAADRAPPTVRFSKQALSKAFKKQIDFDKPVYVHSIEVQSAYNSSPFPLAVKMSGIQNEDVEHVYNSEGSAVAYIIPPNATVNEKETIYTIDQGLDFELLAAHGGATLKSELASLTKINGNVLVKPTTRTGRLMYDNRDKILEEGETSLKVSDFNGPYFVVPESKAVAIMHEYNEDILSQLPITNFDNHTAQISRLDQSGTSNFADLTSVPGVSSHPATQEQLKSTTHLAYVRVNFNIIDQSFFDE